MKKIKTFSFISLDGYLTQIDGDVSWLYEFANPLDKEFKYAEFKESTDCVLINWSLFNLLENYYKAWPFENQFCYLFTERSVQLPKNRLIKSVRTNSYDSTMIIPFLKELRKKSSEKDIWAVGDRELINILMQFGLIDEIHIIIIPKTLGSGTALFAPNSANLQWKLIGHYISKKGAVKLSYIKI